MGPKHNKGKIHFILFFFVSHRSSQTVHTSTYKHRPWRKKWFSMSPAAPHSHLVGEVKLSLTGTHFSVRKKATVTHEKHMKVGWTQRTQRIYIPSCVHHRLSRKRKIFLLLHFLWPRSKLLLLSDVNKKPKKRLILNTLKQTSTCDSGEQQHNRAAGFECGSKLRQTSISSLGEDKQTGEWLRFWF